MGQRAHVQVRKAIIAITDEMFHPNGGPYHESCRSCVKERTACVGRPYRLIEYRSITTDGFPLWIRPACKTCIRLQRRCSCGTTSTDVGYHFFSDNHDPEPSHVRRGGVSWNVILNSVALALTSSLPPPRRALGLQRPQPGSPEPSPVLARTLPAARRRPWWGGAGRLKIPPRPTHRNDPRRLRPRTRLISAQYVDMSTKARARRKTCCGRAPSVGSCPASGRVALRRKDARRPRPLPPPSPSPPSRDSLTRSIASNSRNRGLTDDNFVGATSAASNRPESPLDEYGAGAGGRPPLQHLAPEVNRPLPDAPPPFIFRDASGDPSSASAMRASSSARQIWADLTRVWQERLNLASAADVSGTYRQIAEEMGSAERSLRRAADALADDRNQSPCCEVPFTVVPQGEEITLSGTTAVTACTEVGCVHCNDVH